MMTRRQYERDAKLCPAKKHILRKGQKVCRVCAEAALFDRKRVLANIGMEVIEEALALEKRLSPALREEAQRSAKTYVSDEYLRTTRRRVLMEVAASKLLAVEALDAANAVENERWQKAAKEARKSLPPRSR